MEDQEEENNLKSEALSVSTNNEVFLEDLSCKYGTQFIKYQYFRLQYYSEKTHSNRNLKTMVVSKMWIY